MQISRLFEMLYLLLERESVTARELAERFEVSTRTIYRDLDALGEAGVPVYAVKGRGGGIRILPGFVLDKSLLSQQEQSGILSALQGLKAAGDADAAKVLDKVSSLFRRSEAPWIAVDFTGWGGRTDVFETLKSAVQNKLVVRFGYFGGTGKESQRTVEPLQLYFKGSNWYLKAFCREAGALRMFRLSRIRALQSSEESFARVLAPEEEELEENWTGGELRTILLRMDRNLGFRVQDEFEPEAVEEQQDGSFLVRTSFPVDNWTVGYILSFGGGIQVLEPAELRGRVQQEAKEILNLYEGQI